MPLSETAFLSPTFDEQLAILRESDLFDADFYLRAHPEIKLLEVGADKHYLMCGSDLNYDPHQDFDTRFYRDAHPMVLASGLNPLVHYHLHG